MRVRLMLLGIILIVPACATTDADRDALRRGYSLYNDRRLDESEAAATKFINANPNSPNLDEALYLRGISRLTRGESGSRQFARADLQLAIQKSSRPDLKSKAYRALGDIDYDSTLWQPASDEYQKALVGATKTSLTYLNYRIGACLQALGKWGDARTWFSRVAATNDDSYLTERAVTRMDAAIFALQFGAFQDGPKAAELAAQLKAASIPAAVSSEIREGKLLYLVKTGSFHTWAEADAARDRYLAKYPLVTIVP